jgi:Domain of unknown function (DUF4845)
MKRQRGLGMVGVLIVLVLVLVVGITLMRVIPAYIEFMAVKKVLASMAAGGDLDKPSVKEIRDAFERRAAIDNITSVKGEDLEVAKDGTRTVVSASYTTRIPLVANVSLLLDFNASSQK